MQLDPDVWLLTLWACVPLVAVILFPEDCRLLPRWIWANLQLARVNLQLAWFSWKLRRRLPRPPKR